MQCRFYNIPTSCGWTNNHMRLADKLHAAEKTASCGLFKGNTLSLNTKRITLINNSNNDFI